MNVLVVHDNATNRELLLATLGAEGFTVCEAGELRRARDFQLTLLDDFPTPIWRSGVDGQCDYFNHTWLQFTGRKLEEELGEGWTRGVHGEDLKRVMESYREAFHARRPFQIEYRLRRFDGVYRDLVDSGRSYRGLDGEFAGYIGACYDVTERKQAQEALRESEQQMRLFMEATADCLWNWDLITGNLVRSVGFSRAFGYTVQEMDPTIAWWQERLHPDDLERVLSSFQAAVANGGQTCSYEYRFRRKDGTYAAIHDRAYIVRDGNGKPLRALGAMTDMTERKRAEEELRESREQLRAFAARLQDVREEESLRISREIHDALGHALTSLSIDLITLEQSLAKAPPQRDQILHRTQAMAKLVEETGRTIQRIAMDLRPSLLDDLDLAAALEWQVSEFAARTGLRCRWRHKPDRLGTAESPCHRRVSDLPGGALQHRPPCPGEEGGFELCAPGRPPGVKHPR